MVTRGVAYSFEISLASLADPDIFQVDPTLVVGDVKASQDGGSLSNITTLPAVIDAGKLATVDLSATEMIADRVAVLFSDQAGDEWQDLLILVTTVDARRGVAYSFEMALPSLADPAIFQINPTLAVGDVKVSKDGGSLSNITTLPTVIDAGKLATVDLSATEMIADRVAVLFSDQAGDEWQDLLILVTTVDARRGVAYSFELALASLADPAIFQINPTLAVGDVKVSKDGGSLSNITTLPTVIDAGKLATVDLSATEMTADRVAVLFSDQAGNEWQDLLIAVYDTAPSITASPGRVVGTDS